MARPEGMRTGHPIVEVRRVRLGEVKLTGQCHIAASDFGHRSLAQVYVMLKPMLLITRLHVSSSTKQLWNTDWRSRKGCRESANL